MRVIAKVVTWSRAAAPRAGRRTPISDGRLTIFDAKATRWFNRPSTICPPHILAGARSTREQQAGAGLACQRWPSPEPAYRRPPCLLFSGWQ